MYIVIKSYCIFLHLTVTKQRSTCFTVCHAMNSKVYPAATVS